MRNIWCLLWATWKLLDSICKTLYSNWTCWNNKRITTKETENRKKNPWHVPIEWIQHNKGKKRKKNYDMRMKNEKWKQWKFRVSSAKHEQELICCYCFVCIFQVSEPILNKTFHRKVQSKKVFTHRDSFDVIIAKTEEKLAQVLRSTDKYVKFFVIKCTVREKGQWNSTRKYVRKIDQWHYISIVCCQRKQKTSNWESKE